MITEEDLKQELEELLILFERIIILHQMDNAFFSALKEDKSLFNECGNFFKDLNLMIHEQMKLKLCLFFDYSSQSVSIPNLHDKLKINKINSNCLDNLYSKIESTIKKIRPARNKRIAHIDRGFAIGEKSTQTLGGIPCEEHQNLIDNLATYLNFVFEKLNHTRGASIEIVDNDGVDTFLEIYKEGVSRFRNKRTE